jgi:hypothetical protein
MALIHAKLTLFLGHLFVVSYCRVCSGLVVIWVLLAAKIDAPPQQLQANCSKTQLQ